METATLAGGCFWCTEAIFERLKGVGSVVSGYTGGTTPNPTYNEVCSGNTGHTEVIQISFDPSIISFKTLLDVYWHLHDPTTLNQQGNDVGIQYRSAIFYHNANQEQIAQSLKQKLNNEDAYKGKVVTEIIAFNQFYPAEDNHRDYYAKNSYAPYCQYVIDPKIQKLLKDYPFLLRDEIRR